MFMFDASFAMLLSRKTLGIFQTRLIVFPLHAQLAFLKFSFDIFWVQGVSESRGICHRCVFQAGEDSQFAQSTRSRLFL